VVTHEVDGCSAAIPAQVRLAGHGNGVGAIGSNCDRFRGIPRRCHDDRGVCLLAHVPFRLLFHDSGLGGGPSSRMAAALQRRCLLVRGRTCCWRKMAVARMIACLPRLPASSSRQDGPGRFSPVARCFMRSRPWRAGTKDAKRVVPCSRYRSRPWPAFRFRRISERRGRLLAGAYATANVVGEEGLR